MNTSRKLTEKQQEELLANVKHYMEPYEDLLASNTLTQEYVNQKREQKVEEELNRLFPPQPVSDHSTTDIFSYEEMQRQPWLKEMLNHRDMRRRHELAVAKDAEAWEEATRKAFVAKATAGALSPMMVIIGHYLLYSTDLDRGRRHLLNLLIHQEPSRRLPMHNWLVLSEAPDGLEMVEGEKVEKLTVPLFPYLDHHLHELNARILMSAELQGGAAPYSGNPRDMFIDDNAALGTRALRRGKEKSAQGPELDRLAEVNAKLDALLNARQEPQNPSRWARNETANRQPLRPNRQDQAVTRLNDSGIPNRSSRTYRGGEMDLHEVTKNE